MVITSARLEKSIMESGGTIHQVNRCHSVELPGQGANSIPPSITFSLRNHFDAFGDIVALHNSRVYNAMRRDDSRAPF